MKLKVFFERSINSHHVGSGTALLEIKEAELDEVTGIAWAGRMVERRTAKGVEQAWERLGWGVHLGSRTVVHDLDKLEALSAEQVKRQKATEAARVEEEARQLAKKSDKAAADAAAKKAEAERLRGGKAA